MSPRGRLAALCTALVAYGLVQILAIGRFPSGLCNDAAEEGLRGLLLLAEKRVEILTFVVGNSAETLWLYLTGALTWLAGPTWHALVLPSALSATACVGLGAAVVRRCEPSIPIWIPLGVFSASVWLFHYGQSGYRAASSLIFVLLVAIFVDRAESSRVAAIVAGGVAALSVYAYTSNRVLPIALALYFAVRWTHGKGSRSAILRAASLAGIAALLVSVPNLLFLFRRPGDFLFRGAYVLPPTLEAAVRNVLGTVIVPFHYADVYRNLRGADHLFDGVSAALTASGLNPIDLPTAIAAVAGAVLLARRRMPLSLFLALVLLVSTLLLGPTGPSLTRLLPILPIYLVLASIGAGAAAARGRGFGAAVGLGLVLLLWIRARAYTGVFERDGPWVTYLSRPVTALAHRAAALAERGERVLCVVGESANTVRYFTFRQADSVAVAEFYGRPLVPAEVPFASFRPTVLLVQASPAWTDWALRYGRLAAPPRSALYTEVVIKSSPG